MPRPQTKTDLIEAATANFEKLQTLMNTMKPEELHTEFDFSADSKKKEAHWKRDKNLRDILMHLYEWHNLMLEWLQENKAGNQKPFLMKGYNWRNYGDMNLIFWKRNQNIPLETAKKQLAESHAKIMAEIDAMTNEELFQKSFYSWTGNNSIGSYFVSVTSSHYDWAMKKIKAHRKIVYGR